ncbi:EndoU domain-containing protein [Xanthomonas axonopodis]|uniref:EndoU domain-containing protein n=1 Tax=Xanthomonas axonopodis TaxID=53413 RepID=UPI001F14B46C|nr:EndoU domain-containing protein [Xanthomonas axonopodis]
MDALGIDHVSPMAEPNNYVDIIPPEIRQHILYGDGSGSGGHMWPGQHEKSVFPQSWGADKIIHEIGDIATCPKTTWYAQTGIGEIYTRRGDPAKWVAFEVRGGVRIRVVYQPAIGKVITAFPDDTPMPSLKTIE